MKAPVVGQEGYPPEVIGYAEPWIVAPGDTVAIKVSSIARSYMPTRVEYPEKYGGPYLEEHRSQRVASFAVISTLENLGKINILIAVYLDILHRTRIFISSCPINSGH